MRIDYALPFSLASRTRQSVQHEHHRSGQAHRSHHVDVGVAELVAGGKLVLELVDHLGPSDVEALDPGPAPGHLLVALVEADAAPRAELPQAPAAGEDGQQLLPGQVGPVEAQRAEPGQGARQRRGVLGLDGARGPEAGEARAVPAELRGEGGEGGARLGVELQMLEQRPPRDELRQARLVAGGELRERQAPQPRAPATTPTRARV